MRGSTRLSVAVAFAFATTFPMLGPSFAQSGPSPQTLPPPDLTPQAAPAPQPSAQSSPASQPSPSPSPATAAPAQATPAMPASTAPSSQASPSPEALQPAHELVAVVGEQSVAQTISGLTAQVWPSIEQSLRAPNPKIDAATAADLRKEYERLLTEDYNEIMADAPAIYARYFTVQEMRDLIAFYRTPVGAKALSVMPQALTELAAKNQERMQGLQEKVFLAFLNVLHKRGLYAN